MASLPAVSGAAALKAFRRAGRGKDRQHGSHVILLNPGSPASLPVLFHRELAPGMLGSPVRASGMSVEQFVDLL